MTSYNYKYNQELDCIYLYEDGECLGYIGNERMYYPTDSSVLSSSDIAEIHNVQLNFLFIKRYLLENEKA
jgi:hypothetical protein